MVIAYSIYFAIFACAFVFLGCVHARAAGELSIEQSLAEYTQKLREYEALHGRYEEEARSYWQSIAEKRKARLAKRGAQGQPQLDDYVLTQPPIYRGPPKPVDPTKPPGEPEKPVTPPIPTVADFLRHAQEQYGFAPTRPRREADYKKAYARTAREAGLTREQIVRVYGFESGGNGTYDIQAGLEQPGPKAKAISTALGYNQLLNTNSVELLAESGDKFLASLHRRLSDLNGKKKQSLLSKIQIFERMIEFSRTVPDDWSAHERIAAQPKGLAIHALNLDIDIGPLLQTQKLLDSVIYAKKKSYPRPLAAAELEMMNLTGDGNGLDMISLPQEMRDQVPTSNFFQRGGYDRNPVARRNATVGRLIAATDAVMDREARLPGAKALSSLYDRAQPKIRFR